VSGAHHVNPAFAQRHPVYDRQSIIPRPIVNPPPEKVTRDDWRLSESAFFLGI
jgi:hypothetical protein